MIRLIVGLGNDDEKYRNTLHNVGFSAVALLAHRLNLTPQESRSNRFYRNPLCPVALATPHSYMNVCGPHVKEALMKCGGDVSSFLVVSDDFTLAEGRLRFRREGSSGGHNGLKSVIETLGTEAFPRLRVGVGPVPAGMDPADYVLKRISNERLGDMAKKAADALEACLAEGLEKAMNRFNASSAA